jgi:hypothetical protein
MFRSDGKRSTKAVDPSILTLLALDSRIRTKHFRCQAGRWTFSLGHGLAMAGHLGAPAAIAATVCPRARRFLGSCETNAKIIGYAIA